LKEQAEEEIEYRKYQAELRKMILDQIALKHEQAVARNHKINENKDKLTQKKAEKFREKAFEKMELIESFRQTLIDIEWKSIGNEAQKAQK
jgi:hypothetical protein